MDEELDLLELFYVFWKKKIWLIIAMIWGAAMGVVYTRYMVEPKYSSSVTLILSKPTTEVATDIYNTPEGGITQSDIILNQNLISTYREIMESRRVSKAVIEKLSLNMSYAEFKKCINVSSVKDTDVIKLSITTTEPELSAKIATEMINVFSEEVVKIYNIKNVSIIDEAEVNRNPVNVNYTKNAVIFAMVLFILIALVIFLIYYFDNTIKSKDEIEKLLEVPVLAVIPMIDGQKEEKNNVKE